MEKPSRTIGNLFGLLKTKSVIEDHVQNPRALSPFAVAENEARAKNRNTNDGILKLYNENPHLNNAVDLISMAVSQVDWYACDKDGNEIESEALDVLRKPNASMSRVAMFALDQTYHETLGEYFWVAARSANGKVFGFDVVAPFHVVELPTQAKRKYKIQSGKSVVEIPSDDVIHFKRINPSNPYGRGIGIAYTLGDEIDCDELSARHIKGVLNNNAIPKALVTLEGANADELARFADEFRDKNRTGDRQGRTHFVGGTIKADVKLLEHSFGDLKLLELRQYSSEVIRKTYKIPPELMGNVDNSNRATIEAAMDIFASMAISPRLEFIASELNTKYMRWFPNETGTVLKFRNPTPESKQFQFDAMRAQPSSVTPNEWRRMQGLPWREGGDELGSETASLPQQLNAPHATTKAIEDVDDDYEPFEPLWRRIRGVVDPQEFATKTTAVIEESTIHAANSAAKSLGLEGTFNRNSGAILDYVANYSSTKVVEITKTTMDAIRKHLEIGVDKGEGVNKLKQRVKEAFGEDIGRRAEVIARTEVLTSSNAGRAAAFEEAGDIIGGLEWLATKDDRTRDAHSDLDGVWVKTGENFKSSLGGEGPYPTNMNNAEDDIQCRCVALPVLSKNIEGGRKVREALTPVEKDAYWTKVDRAAARFEIKMQRATKAALESQLQTVLKALER